MDEINTPERVREARLALGWTQERMAAELGVAHETVNRWERGKLKITSRTAKQIAHLVSRETQSP